MNKSRQILWTLVQNLIGCSVSTDDVDTCSCAYWADLASLTRDHVLIMAVLADESMSQLSVLLLFTFNKLFKGLPHSLCDVPAWSFMHLRLHPHCAWTGYYLVICPHALLTG